MGFANQSFSPGQELLASHLNQFNENDDFLFQRLLFWVNQNLVSYTGYCFFVVRFEQPQLINPAANEGTGADGVTWRKLWLKGNAMAIQVNIPNTVFSATPFIVGHTTGSEAQWGIVPASRWAETATSYKVAFVDTGGPTYPINSSFAYCALLLGPRKGTPT
jgi:hypothetical protein